jgi:hypothetical protein
MAVLDQWNEGSFFLTPETIKMLNSFINGDRGTDKANCLETSYQQRKRRSLTAFDSGQDVGPNYLAVYAGRY